jgi:hypothetical protein
MQEELKKNFVLLSKVAKEKKYAQEYLGLLARRGDLGSIRIGKRWYTTPEWFAEFLENSEKKKVGIMSEAVEEVKENFVEEKISIIHPRVIVERKLEGKVVEEPAMIPVMVKTKEKEIPSVIKVSRDIREIKKEVVLTQKENFIERKNEAPFPDQEMEFRKNSGFFSPDFLASKKEQEPLFPRFAFAVGFAIMLLLVAVSGYFIFSGGLLRKGTVAGASDERNGSFSSIKLGSGYYLTSAGDKIKESISISRLVVEAAKEKNNNGN